MENSEAKSLFSSSKTHRNVTLNVVHGQAIENTKYVDILDTTCLKNNPFDSLSFNILSMFFNLAWKVVYYRATCHTFKVKAEKIKKSPHWKKKFLYFKKLNFAALILRNICI